MTIQARQLGRDSTPRADGLLHLIRRVPRLRRVQPCMATLLQTPQQWHPDPSFGESLSTKNPRRRRAGMTLVELMVSVGVLVLLMMIFSQILSSAQRVSIKSNSLVQSNSATTAIAQLLREDLQSLNPNGFLVITPDIGSPPAATPNDADYRNCLSFAAIGMCVSASTPAYKANEAIISYGLVNDAKSCLWRNARVLLDIPVNPPAPTPQDDWDPKGLKAYMDLPSVPNAPTAGDLEYIVRTPPPSGPGTDWRELDKRCVAFKVYWWNNEQPTPAWDASPKTWKELPGLPVKFPPALRITFTLCMDETELSRYRSDPTYRPKETREFEVICPIRP